MPAILLFDPQLVITRLRAQVTALRKVAGAADFAAAAPDLKQTPAAFVLDLAARAGRNLTGTLLVEQSVEIRFGIVVGVQNLRDPRGETAQTGLRTVRESILTALLGWQPAADYDPCEYGSGRLVQIDNQVLWWQDEYITRIIERSI